VVIAKSDGMDSAPRPVLPMYKVVMADVAFPGVEGVHHG
jgi:hypothetical protein